MFFFSSFEDFSSVEMIILVDGDGAICEMADPEVSHVPYSQVSLYKGSFTRDQHPLAEGPGEAISLKCPDPSPTTAGARYLACQGTF